jgi:hypothetical protein
LNRRKVRIGVSNGPMHRSSAVFEEVGLPKIVDRWFQRYDPTSASDTNRSHRGSTINRQQGKEQKSKPNIGWMNRSEGSVEGKVPQPRDPPLEDKAGWVSLTIDFFNRLFVLLLAWMFLWKEKSDRSK